MIDLDFWDCLTCQRDLDFLNCLILCNGSVFLGLFEREKAQDGSRINVWNCFRREKQHPSQSKILIRLV